MQLTRAKEWREARGFTQRGLAAEAGLSEVTVARLETGHSSTPSTARKIADALDISVADLLERPPVPLGEAPDQGPASPEAPPLLEDPRVQDWLADQDAALLLMSDQDFVDHVAEVHELEDLETLAGELASEKDRVLTSLNNPDVEKTLFPTHVETFSAKEERLHEAMRPARGTFYLRSEIRGEYLRRELAVSN
jgi:transcriptional regulator with XRE-family HTH domain